MLFVTDLFARFPTVDLCSIVLENGRLFADNLTIGVLVVDYYVFYIKTCLFLTQLRGLMFKSGDVSRDTSWLVIFGVLNLSKSLLSRAVKSID